MQRLIALFALATLAGCATVSVADLPDRPFPDHVSACSKAETKSLSRSACVARWRDYLARGVASAVRITVYRYDAEKNEEGSYVGSGAIINDAGLFLTAAHVVRNADFILVTFRRIREHGDTLYFMSRWQTTAKVVAISEKYDVALLEPVHLQERSRMRAFSLRRGKLPVAGEEVWQFGQKSLFAEGAVAKWPSRITTDGVVKPAAEMKLTVHQGDSGGPVVSLDGRLVGIVVAMSEDKPNIGYMVPIDLAFYALRDWFRETHVFEIRTE